MNRYRYLACALVALIFLALTLLLRPGDRELALMQIENQQFTEALAKFEALRKSGDNSVNVIMPLSHVYREWGDMESAIAIMERFVADHPYSPEALQYLGQLYQDAQMPYHYLRIIQQEETARPAVATQREMAYYYNLRGDYAREAEVLARLVTSDGYAPLEEDYVKLATYYSIQNKTAEALEPLKFFIEYKKYNVDADTMDLALGLQMRVKAKEALSMAGAYAAKKQSVRVVAHLSNFFRDQHRPELALELLESFADFPDPQGEWLAEWANTEFTLGKQDKVLPVLTERFEKGTLPEPLLESLIDLALKAGNYKLLDRLIAKTQLANLPQEELVRLAEMLLISSKPDLAQAMQERLGKDYLRENEVLAEILNVAVLQSAEALKKLIKHQARIAVDDDQKIMLIEIYNRFGAGAQAFTLLQTLPMDKMLDNYDTDYVVDLYAGRAADGVKLFTNAQPSLSGARLDKARDIRDLLMIAAGDKAMLRIWTGKKHISDPMLETASDLAEKYQRRPMSVILAAEIYRRHPTDQNHLEFAETLIANQEYGRALSNLSKLASHDHEAAKVYRDAIEGLIRQMVAQGKQREVKTMIAQFLRRPEVNTDDKRVMGYALMDAGFSEEAANIFFPLAQNAPVDNPDLQELLFIWGRNLTPGAASWLKERTMHSQGEVQAKWLGYLGDAGQSQAVIDVVEASGNATEKTMEIYTGALIATGNKKKLASFLNHQLARELPAQQLRKLAGIAVAENMVAATEGGLRSLLPRMPDDPDLLKSLASLDMQQGKYAEAKELLNRYLKQKSDAETQYIYGEILWREKHYSEAIIHYDEAMKYIALNNNGSFDDRLMEAHILRRKNETEKSIQLFQKLLSEKPGDKSLRADFAGVLLEAKKFNEAKDLLKD